MTVMVFLPWIMFFFFYCNKCVFFFMFSPQHGTTQASELVNLQSFFTANILPELEIKNGECWGYFVHNWYSLTNTGESLLTLIFCLPLTYQIVSEKFCFKIPKIYKECMKQFLQRAETWRNCSNYRSFLIFEPNLQV